MRLGAFGVRTRIECGCNGSVDLLEGSLGVVMLVVLVVLVVVCGILLVHAALVNGRRGIHHSRERTQQRWQASK